MQYEVEQWWEGGEISASFAFIQVLLCSFLLKIGKS
jgi:hypothetical protein